MSKPRRFECIDQEVGGAKKASKPAPVQTSAKPAARTKADGDVLARLQAAFTRRAPGVVSKLKKGASAAAIARLQKAAPGVPAAFCEFLRWHDGADHELRLLDGLVWLGAQESVRIKQMMDGIIEAGHYGNFRADEWWSKGWLPFADDESGYSSLVIDLQGCFGGVPGQVMQAGAKDSTRTILAPSFEAWLTTFTEIVERGYFDDDDGDDDDESAGKTMQFDQRARALFGKRKGFPRTCEPAPVEVGSETAADGLTRPTRGARPPQIPASARWLVSASGDRVEHWFIDHTGKTVTTWTGTDLTRLRTTTKTHKDAHTAAVKHDDQLRKQLYAGFVLGAPVDAKRGDPVCALHVGDGSSAACIDLSPDGRTLAVGTILAEAKGANLYLIDIETGRRRLLHAEKIDREHPQTFIHQVAFGQDGDDLYYQLDRELRVIPVAGGAPTVLASMKEPPLNPHVSQFELDRTRERLLYFDGAKVIVRHTGGKQILKIPGPKSTSEYREAALSPSGKLLALVHRSRAVIYGHEDAKRDKTDEIQIWSVDRGKLLASLPHGEETLRRLSFCPDDKTLIIGTYQDIVAHDIKTGARVWQRKAREWAHSPDGSRLAVAERSNSAQILNAATRRAVFRVHEHHPWARAHAEIHDVAIMGYSADGKLLYEGNNGGRVYVWAMA